MRSYPCLVRFFLIGKLNLSLGVSKFRHTLEAIHHEHIGVLGMAIEYHGSRCTSQFHLIQSKLPKVKYLYVFIEHRANIEYAG